MKVVDFELILSPAGPHYTAVVRCTITKPNHQETVIDTAGKPPMRVVIDQSLLRELALRVKDYGLELGRMLLADPALAKLVAQARVTAQQDRVPLRLRLNLPPDLQPLRWETLRDPHEPDTPLLMTGEQVASSRYLSSTDWRPVGPRPFGARRALVLLANPPDLEDYNLEPLVLGQQHELIRETFGAMPTVVLDAGQARLDRLIEELRSGPDILLILAHGWVDGDGDMWLYLEGANGLTEPVRPSALAERIAELSVRPPLIILGVCESAGNGYGSLLLALGPKLAEIGVLAVLAMQARITVETLREFLPACLRKLEQAGRIDQAVSHARGVVRERPDFWVPVLFQRLLSGRLWQMSEDEPETPEELLERMPTDRVPEDGPPLASVSRLRLQPNPQFVGRTKELCDLAARLKVSRTVAITTGIGGVGKTQLARMFAEHYGGYFAGGVFWLSFAEPATIAAEVAASGGFGLVTHPDYASLTQEAQVMQVKAAWQQALPRLLIFDNCEDEERLYEWLPQIGGCRVLVTSRKQTAWDEVLKVQTLPLAVLPRADSVTLLQQLAPHLTVEEAGQIAEALGDLPLALHLAGYYLKRYRVAVAEYLAKLGTARLQHASLQGRGVKRLPTDREPHVEKAFALSFARLDASDPIDDLAQQLLARAACFAPGELIGRWWLEATITPEGDEEEQQLACTDAVERLLGLGLLELVAEGVVRLHRLLAAYAALALNDTDALPTVERVVDWLARKANETKVPQAMLPVLPHLRYLVQGAQGREDEMIAALCANLGFYLKMIGSYTETQPLYERALAICERVLGADHPDTASNLNNLAELYRAQGGYERALPLYERALAIYERVLGADHPDTARSLNNLAGLYQLQGAYERALPLYERALVIKEQVLGDDHSSTAASLNNLAGLLKAQGAYERALPLYERASAICERVLGSDHPDTATSLNSLAGLHQAQGAYEQALPLYERALAICERVLGADHPSTATSLNNLANLLEAQGAYERALPLYERALALRERVLGADHPSTATSLNNLAGFLKAQGAYEQALPLYERALAICERVLGSDHPDTAQSLNNLALLFQAQGGYERALPLYERALAICEWVLGADHPSTATSLNNLAGLLEAQGAYERAVPLYERALALRERVLGADHPDTAGSLNNLATLHANQGQFAQALPLQERAITILQQCLGPQHPTTVQAQRNLAVMRQDAVVADLPPALRTAFQAGDAVGFQQALQALPPEEAQAIVQQLIDVGLLPKPDDDPFGPLLQAIVAVAQGDDGPRAEVETALAQAEQGAFHLTAAVQAIWTGERNVVKLTQGLDREDYRLVRRLLTMLTEAEAAKGRADLLARAEARVAAAGDDPQARADLAERLAAVAASYASGSPQDQALAAQLQALIDQLSG